jgi:hypothetical protein
MPAGAISASRSGAGGLRRQFLEPRHHLGGSLAHLLQAGLGLPPAPFLEHAGHGLAGLVDAPVRVLDGAEGGQGAMPGGLGRIVVPLAQPAVPVVRQVPRIQRDLPAQGRFHPVAPGQMVGLGHQQDGRNPFGHQPHAGEQVIQFPRQPVDGVHRAFLLLRGGGQFLARRGVAVGNGRQLADHLVQPGVVLAHSGAGFGGQAERLLAFPQAGDGGRHVPVAGFRGALAQGAVLPVLLHQRGDGAGGLARALGQLAHLVGHHREAPAGVAGLGRLDGGVEAEQVGLPGDLTDDLQGAFHPRAGGVDLADGLAVLLRGCQAGLEQLLQGQVAFGGALHQGLRLFAAGPGAGQGPLGGFDGGRQVMGAPGHLLGGLGGLVGRRGQFPGLPVHPLDLDLDVEKAELQPIQETVQHRPALLAGACREVEALAAGLDLGQHPVLPGAGAPEAAQRGPGGVENVAQLGWPVPVHGLLPTKAVVWFAPRRLGTWGNARKKND